MFEFWQEFSAAEKHSIDSHRDWRSSSISRESSMLAACWHHTGSVPQPHSQGSPLVVRKQHSWQCQQRRTRRCICGAPV